jgi:hypothetical protein
MIIGTNLLRQGLILANQKRHPALRIIVVRAGEGRTTKIDDVASAPFSTTVHRRLSPHSLSSSSLMSSSYGTLHSPHPCRAPSECVGLSLDATYWTPTIALAPIVLGDAALPSSSRRAMTTSTTRVYRTMPPSLRVAIAADLRSVDHDMDGMIGAEELGALLRKHESAFAEGEIVELSELFYNSMGGSKVSINNFLEALDDASAGGGGEIAMNGGLNSLGSNGKLKTHPLGIGTCASEYM